MLALTIKKVKDLNPHEQFVISITTFSGNNMRITLKHDLYDVFLSFFLSLNMKDKCKQHWGDYGFVFSSRIVNMTMTLHVTGFLHFLMKYKHFQTKHLDFCFENITNIFQCRTK